MIFGDVDNATVGTVIFYSCNTNFELVGFVNRVCAPGGVWSGEAPTCEGKKELLEIITAESSIQYLT